MKGIIKWEAMMEVGVCVQKKHFYMVVFIKMFQSLKVEIISRSAVTVSLNNPSISLVVWWGISDCNKFDI